MAHTCHVPNCSKITKPAVLMCGRHWYMVTKDLQTAVWRTYRRGQEIDKKPSPEYIQAARNAIECVVKRESEMAKRAKQNKPPSLF